MHIDCIGKPDNDMLASSIPRNTRSSRSWVGVSKRENASRPDSSAFHAARLNGPSHPIHNTTTTRNAPSITPKATRDTTPPPDVGAKPALACCRPIWFNFLK